jgi:hypothetical protein
MAGNSTAGAIAMAAGPAVAAAAKAAPVAKNAVWALLGGMAAAVGLYFSYQYSHTIFLGIIIGGAVGLLSGMTKKLEGKEGRLGAVITRMGLFIAVGVAVGLFWPTISSYASDLYSKASVFLPSIFTQFKQAATPEYYAKLLQSPSTQQEKSTLSVEFINPYFKSGNPLDIIVKLSVYTPDMNTKILPTCSLDGTPLEVEIAGPGNEISFSKSSIQQSTSLHCKGASHEGTLKLELQRPLSIKTDLPLIIAPQFTEDRGIPSAKTDAPFSLTIGVYNNQPLLPGTYDLPILLKKNDANTEMVSITSLKLTTLSKSVSLECPKFSSIANGFAISNLNAAALQNYVQSPTGDLYVFNCKLNVLGADQEETIYITSEALYNIKSSYTSKVNSIA